MIKICRAAGTAISQISALLASRSGPDAFRRRLMLSTPSQGLQLRESSGLEVSTYLPQDLCGGVPCFTVHIILSSFFFFF